MVMHKQVTTKLHGKHFTLQCSCKLSFYFSILNSFLTLKRTLNLESLLLIVKKKLINAILFKFFKFE